MLTVSSDLRLPHVDHAAFMRTTRILSPILRAFLTTLNQICQGWERKTGENSGVERPMFEARMVENTGRVLGEGGSKHQLGGMGERCNCKLPSGVWGGTPAEIEFGAF